MQKQQHVLTRCLWVVTEENTVNEENRFLLFIGMFWRIFYLRPFFPDLYLASHLLSLVFIYVIVGLFIPFKDIIIYCLLPRLQCCLNLPMQPGGLWLENMATVAQKAERIHRKTGLNEFMLSQSGE